MTNRPDLQIHLLGDLKLLSRGRALVLPPSKKTRALLAFLVATGRPHLRESLCDLYGKVRTTRVARCVGAWRNSAHFLTANAQRGS